MKTLATIIIGLGLFLGSSLFAQDKFAAFYPLEDNDSPSYALHDDGIDSSSIALSLDSTTRAAKNDMTFAAFYPMEDDDSAKYGFSEIDTSGIALSLDTRSTRSAKHDMTFDAFYPMEDDDSVRY